MFWTLISSVILFPWSKLVVTLLTLSYPDVCNHIDFFQRASLDAWRIKSTPWSSTTIAWSERRRLNGHLMRYWYTRVEHCLRLEIRITEESSWVLDIAHFGKIMRVCCEYKLEGKQFIKYYIGVECNIKRPMKVVHSAFTGAYH